MINMKDLIKQQGDVLRKESAMKINEGVDFKVTIEDRKGKLIQRGTFTFKDDANKYIKDMIKKHKLRRGKGLWYNDKGVELTTNF